MLARHFSVFKSWNEPDDVIHSGLRLPKCSQYVAAGQRPCLLGSLIGFTNLASLVRFFFADKLYQKARYTACRMGETAIRSFLSMLSMYGLTLKAGKLNISVFISSIFISSIVVSKSTGRNYKIQGVL